ncbi:LacI family transcriptional regulator [Microbacterium halimionae]|uniref:LacI family transcriptional regulator n=1 Tax=Microbacterium halimionae TaxID=1526413 RepID=A0A7W3JLL8_9MICO|nr:LacI family DNA-binding transcriptional regulator [Microbacterium halimionae]MBA8815162.1 LacI family transcriptional regulator [Microbacterium halimionae]NII94047.1 LacI family transcriptional regulator [Microbacterium halimionae]
MGRVGIRDVADRADVAVGTVSNFLNHPDKVSADKAQRIQQAIESLGFVPSNAGRQLRLGVSTVIGYIAPDVSNPHFAEIAESVELRASDRGVSVFIGNSHRSREREDAYIQVFEQHQVRGLLVSSHEPIEERLAQVRRRGTPSVLIGQRAASLDQPSVSIDDVSGGRQAMQHLLDIGCRHVAFVGGPLGIPQVSARLAGASEVARGSGTTLEVINMPDRTVRGGHEVGEALLQRHAAQRPDGVFAVNDLLALGILNAVATGGVHVPREMAVVGYDDNEFAEASLIPLTSVRGRHQGFGTAVMDLLFDMIERRPVEDIHRVLEPDLMVRASSAGIGSI